MTDTSPTIYLGTSEPGTNAVGVYVTPETARDHYAGVGNPRDGETWTVTCDSCVTALYVIDHGMVGLSVPHLATEDHTSCLPCMVGAVAYGGGWIADTDITPAPPVPDTSTPARRSTVLTLTMTEYRSIVEPADTAD